MLPVRHVGVCAPDGATATVSDPDPVASRRRVPERALLATFVAVSTTALVLLLWFPAARLDFYFDEIWRVEIVRSSSPVAAYLAGPAPIPPGWVVALSSIFDFVPDRRPLLRLAAASLAIPAALLLASAVRRVLERRMDPIAACTVAAIAAPLTIATPALAIHATYFNNYMTDVAVATAIIWTLTAIDDSDSMIPWWSLLALSIFAPWFGQGALFLLPGAAVIVARNAHGHRRIAGASAAVALVSFTLVGLAFLRPVAEGATLTDYWKAETPAIGLVSFARRFFTTFVDGAYPQTLADRPLALVVMGGLTTFGAIEVHRACRWWMPLFASAAVLATIAAVVTGWPATFVRSNSSYQILLFALAPIGVGCLVVRTATRLMKTTQSRVAAGAWIVVIGLALAGIWMPRSIRANSASDAVFARGLTDDVATVAARLSPGDVVLAYHLSGPYVRDGILNSDDEVDDVRVVDEARVGPLTSVRPWTRNTTGSVWCVIPFEAGPEATENACPTSADWSIATKETGRRATLIGLTRAR